MLSKQARNLLRAETVGEDDLDVQVANLAAQHYGMNTEIVMAEGRKEDTKIHLEATYDLLKNLNQPVAADWMAHVWVNTEADHKLIKEQDILNTGLNEANRIALQQRNTAVFEKAQIDEAIAAGKSDDPALRAMLRQMEVETHYVVWTSIDDTVCKNFPQVSQGAVHCFLNALSGAVPMSAYQNELMVHLLATFEQMAAAS